MPNGASVEREAPRPSGENGSLVLELRNPDFETAVRIADAINRYSQEKYHQRIARERDNRSVALTSTRGGATRLLAEIGELRVEPSTPARVVIDERTGTVVIGQDVKISPVASTHGGLTVRINETPGSLASRRRSPMARRQSRRQTRITATEEVGGVATLEGPTLRTLVRGLNQIGLKPTGIISILQAIKTAGALQADLVIQ